MSLAPTFSVTPLNPRTYSYDSATGVYNHYANLWCFGAFIHAYSPYRLTDQYSQNKAVLYYNYIPTPAPATMPSPYYRNSVALLHFKTQATTEDQYLLIYHLGERSWGRAAFYVNGNLVRSEQISGEETIAITLDCPSPQTYTYIYMFLEGSGLLELKGIECYVL